MINQIKNQELASSVDLVESPNPGANVFGAVAVFTWITFALRIPVFVLAALTWKR